MFLLHVQSITDLLTNKHAFIVLIDAYKACLFVRVLLGDCLVTMAPRAAISSLCEGARRSRADAPRAEPDFSSKNFH
jgi:hypothetical protein